MKVVLDLTKLQRDGHITPEESQRLSQLAALDTGSVAFNILIGLGVVAVAGAALAMVPNPATGVMIGALLLAAGVYVFMRHPAWLVLANICTLVAALMFGGGIMVLSGSTITSYLFLAVIFLAGAVVARSALLVTLSVLAVVGAVGAGTFYSHAFYEIDIMRPLLTILVCGGLALAALQASKHLPPAFERLCLIAARAALFFANMGFWVGSLWGDRLDWASMPDADDAPAFLPASLFAIGWAAALVVVGIWAVRENRRWVLNITAVFGAIHFYTQWFEHLSATPVSVLIAGLVTLGVALVLWKLNGQRNTPTPHRPERAIV